MSSLNQLHVEPCEICKKRVNLSLKTATITPTLTGMDTFLDMHGILDNPPHVRVLYVDAHGSVRSYVIIKKFVGVPPELNDILKL